MKSCPIIHVYAALGIASAFGCSASGNATSATSTGGTSGLVTGATSAGTSSGASSGQASSGASVSSASGTSGSASNAAGGTSSGGTNGNPGGTTSGFACFSDADCQTLADPLHAHCNFAFIVDAGGTSASVACVQCLQQSDCPTSEHCDLRQPVLSFGGLAFQTPSATFETCLPYSTDCRSDAGVLCPRGSYCSSLTGSCTQPAYACNSDQDCAGKSIFTPYANPPVLLPTPSCVAGQCQLCPSDAGLSARCPVGAPYCTADSCTDPLCTSNADCGNPSGADGGLICDSFPAGNSPTCGCRDNGDCGGDTPVCILDAGWTDVEGAVRGLCGCIQNADCPAGTLCAPYQFSTPGNGSVSGCIPGCDPDLCAQQLGQVCDIDSGLCSPCTTNDDCAAAPPSAGGPLCTPAGTCGCASDSDCPPTLRCQSEGQSKRCDLPCPTTACPLNTICDLDAGDCVACVTSYDCLAAAAAGTGGGGICNLVDGGPQCNAPCSSDSDCIAAQQGSRCGDGGVCVACTSDADCAGNAMGPSCINGEFADGICGCQSPADCSPASAGCPISLSPSTPFGYCGTCAADSDCQTGYFCGPDDHCRSRCDPGNSCAADQPFCDVLNIAGQQDQTFNCNNDAFPACRTPTPVIWCYGCLTPTDCDGGEGCNPGNPPFSVSYTCGGCYNDNDCLPGSSCISNVCASGCGADGGCPAGKICGAGNLCVDCAKNADCPLGQVCNSGFCGSCGGESASCDPGQVCTRITANSICLSSCDAASCPAAAPICGQYPGYDLASIAYPPQSKFCFGCLSDADCIARDAGASCDLNGTFACR